MNYFMPGLGILVLGFGFYQFSNLFGLYDAQTEGGAPVLYWIFRVLGYVGMALGAMTVVFSLMRAG